MKKKPAKSVYSHVRHPFHVRVTNGDGSEKTIKVMAKVRQGKKAVTLTVTKAHVQKAIDNNGVGSTSKCTMAVCCYAHKDAFPHKIEGHVDWQYSRAFVVTKTNKFGLPSECVAYEHNNEIARMNDTKGGLQKMLRQIEEKGPITVKLKPYRKRSEIGRPGNNRKSTGARDQVIRKGANRRFDVANLSAMPNTET